MVKKIKKAVFPKVKDDVLKCLVLKSVYCHRGGKKPENTHI